MPTKEEIEQRVEEFYGYAITIARNTYQPGHTNIIDIDDAEAAALLGLLKASIRYDDSRGAKFKTYAAIRIRNELRDLYRSPICDYSKALKKVTMRRVSIDFVYDDGNDENLPLISLLEYEDKYIEATENIEHAYNCIAKLPQRYREVISMAGEGMTNIEIGKVIGKTPSRVSQILNEARSMAQEEWFK